MKITRQEDIALLISADLALLYGKGYIPLSKITEKHRLSFKFCQKICKLLKNAGILESKEGVDGGYCLAKSPQDISVWEIIAAVNEKLPDYPEVMKSHKYCPLNFKCLPQRSHQLVFVLIENSLSRVSLSSLSDKGDLK